MRIFLVDVFLVHDPKPLNSMNSAYTGLAKIQGLHVYELSRDCVHKYLDNKPKFHMQQNMA